MSKENVLRWAGMGCILGRRNKAGGGITQIEIWLWPDVLFYFTLLYINKEYI